MSREGSHGRGYKRVSLLVRNLPMSMHVDEVKENFAKYGPLRDVYLPQDHYTRRPRGFAFIEFVDERDAEDAMNGLDGRTWGGREITVVPSKKERKTPQEMKRLDERNGRATRTRSRSRSPARRGRRSRSRSRERSPRRRRRASRSTSRSHDRRSRSRSRTRRRERSPDRKQRREPSPAPQRSPSLSPVRNGGSRGDAGDARGGRPANAANGEPETAEPGEGATVEVGSEGSPLRGRDALSFESD
ncbi:hypothetical protein WJX81_001037 [Elliptochloris bilobata]|uniref:RRM domain-containing protein n=1 Tax=Elliptochloris bilobata TaxID=381761 RepID=A0AAW1SJH7_9CHLO